MKNSGAILRTIGVLAFCGMMLAASTFGAQTATYQLDNGSIGTKLNASDTTEPRDNWFGNVFTAQAGANVITRVDFGVYTATSNSAASVVLYRVTDPGGNPALGATRVYTQSFTPLTGDGTNTFIQQINLSSPVTFNVGDRFLVAVFIPNVIAAQPSDVYPFVLDTSGVATGTYWDRSAPNTFNLNDLSQARLINQPFVTGGFAPGAGHIIIRAEGVAGCISLACATNKTVQCGTAWSFDPPTSPSGNAKSLSVGTVTRAPDGSGGTLWTYPIIFDNTTVVAGSSYFNINDFGPVKTTGPLPAGWSFAVPGTTFTFSQTNVGPNSGFLIPDNPAVLDAVITFQTTADIPPGTYNLVLDTALNSTGGLANYSSLDRVQSGLLKGQPSQVVSLTTTPAAQSTNVTVTILSTVTNGTCPQIITRTWQTTDSCGNTNTCSQTVTVVDTTPPVLTCAANKTVQCGTAWTFDPPTASDACSGTNLTMSVLSTLTNGVAQITFTGGGSAANGQVLFVGNTAISGYLNITSGTKMGTYTLSPGSGSDGSFAWDGLIFPYSNPFLDEDGLLFTNGGVEINLYGNGPGSYTLAGAPPTFAADGAATIAVCPQTITRTWLSTDACGNTNACSQTVTVVDSTPPTLTCTPDKTVQCGTAWSFDPPAASDACSGTNVTIIVLATVTNGSACSQLITRTWLATDPCGNTNTCAQTVTLVSPGLPVITQQPQSQTIVIGSNVTFTVTATGTLPFAYQWYFNGTNAISGATNSAYTIFNAQTNNSGAYDVLVSNSGGSVTSQMATLTLLVIPLLFHTIPERFCVVDITPNSQSGEANQNAEPSLAVGTGSFYRRFVVHAFNSGLNNFYYTSVNGGSTWTSPGTVFDYDCTLDWSSGNTGPGNLTPRTVYAALMPTTLSLNARNSVGLPGIFTPINAATYNPVDTPDQPWVKVVNIAGVDHIYVGFNDLSRGDFTCFGGHSGPGNTASVRYSLDSGATWSTTVIEKTIPGAKWDSPAVRLATSGDGKTVYALFQRATTWTGGACFASDYLGDIVLMREDWSGAASATFNGLGNGTIVASNIRLPWTSSLGAQRLGSGCDVAVNPINPKEVYVAYTTFLNIGGVLTPEIKVQQSVDSGVTFNVVYALDTTGGTSLPALAVLNDGTFGMLYAAKVGNNLEVDFFKVLQGNFSLAANISSRVLATFPNNSPIMVYSPYIGDYFQLKGWGPNFFGTFCASGDPKISHFPSGVYYQRNVKDTATSVVQNNFWLQKDGTLVNLSGQPVNASIDPFFFCDIAALLPFGPVVPVGPSPGPILDPALISGDPFHLKLIWPVLPSTSPQFQLQSSPVLGPLASWTVQTDNVLESDGQFEATPDMSPPQQFFRLSQNVASGQFQIFATADNNGSLNPSGILTNSGLTSRAFTATPSNNYAIAKWYLDGVVVQSNSPTLTISNIGAEHTVVVTFAASNDVAVTVVGLSIDPEEPIVVTEPFDYVVDIANSGLNRVTGVMVTNILDPSVTFVSATSSQGNVTNSASLVTANLGALNPGASATIIITVVPNSEGTITDRVSVVCSQFEPNLANNTATTVNSVLTPVTIRTQPTNQTVNVGGTASFSVGVSGTPPFTYQWFFNGAAIIGATNSTLSEPNVTAANAGPYTVAVLQITGPETMLEADSQTATLTIGGPNVQGGQRPGDPTAVPAHRPRRPLR